MCKVALINLIDASIYTDYKHTIAHIAAFDYTPAYRQLVLLVYISVNTCVKEYVLEINPIPIPKNENLNSEDVFLLSTIFYHVWQI